MTKSEKMAYVAARELVNYYESEKGAVYTPGVAEENGYFCPDCILYFSKKHCGTCGRKFN